MIDWYLTSEEPPVAISAIYAAYKQFEQALHFEGLAEAQAALNYYEDLLVAAGREMIPAHRIYVREGNHA